MLYTIKKYIIEAVTLYVWLCYMFDMMIVVYNILDVMQSSNNILGILFALHVM